MILRGIFFRKCYWPNPILELLKQDAVQTKHKLKLDQVQNLPYIWTKKTLTTNNNNEWKQMFCRTVI